MFSITKAVCFQLNLLSNSTLPIFSNKCQKKKLGLVVGLALRLPRETCSETFDGALAEQLEPAPSPRKRRPASLSRCARTTSATPIYSRPLTDGKRTMRGASGDADCDPYKVGTNPKRSKNASFCRCAENEKPGRVTTRRLR
jgi:hypothetical protein